MNWWTVAAWIAGGAFALCLGIVALAMVLSLKIDDEP